MRDGTIAFAASPSEVVTRFSGGAVGDATPISTLQTPSASGDDADVTGFVRDRRGNPLRRCEAESHRNVYSGGRADVLRGPHTRLSAPQGVTIDPAGLLVVANTDSGEITVYPAGARRAAIPIRVVSGLH